MTATVKRPVFVLLVLAFLVTPILAIPKVNAATTTTKYMNGKIVFDTDRDGNYEIYTVDSDGSNQTRLTNNSSRDRDAAWSPDGSRIAFQANRDGNYEIYTMNADGSNPTRLTNNTATEDEPSWSPDGSKI